MRLIALLLCTGALFAGSPIKVGILHSLTGTMANSEKPVVDATLFAIDEINRSGGVLGCKIVPIVFDGASNWDRFAEGAEKLISQDGVSAIFGCWTSASRKSIKGIIEKHKHLLFNPVQYEGLELSPNIIYTGSAPNQQILPGTIWAYFHLGKRFFLAGSDYVFPRVANEIIKDVVASLGGQIVGEAYIPLGSDAVTPMIQQIEQTKPDVILNTINGDSNIAFFKALRAAGITPEKTPTLSFSLVETEFAHLDLNALIGDYSCWSYFHSVVNPVNAQFVSRLQKIYGQNLRVSDPMEAAYFGVHLWAKAVEKAGVSDPIAVLKTIKDDVYNAPEGMIYLDSSTQHTWKFMRIGKIRGNSNYDVLWSSDQAVEPIPYPMTRDKKDWDVFLNELYEGYGKKWAK